MFLSFNTIYPSEILLTIFVSAIGKEFKSWNLNNAKAKHIIETAKAIGVI